MCLYPKLIKNKKYIPNKSNKGLPPIPKDERVLYVATGCGKCVECMKQKKRNWQVRLHEEIKSNKSAKFVTLTFSEESLYELSNIIKSEDANATATLAVHRFRERWRKKYKTSIKHWLITELGHQNTERLHLHGLLFTDANTSEISTIWKYGEIYIGEYVNARTINYIVKYVTKIDKDHKNYQPIILTSPGIGKKYINSHNAEQNKFKNLKTNESYKLPNGQNIPLPIYYRNHIYNDDEREKLWLNILDKETRYVRGVKIDVSTTEGAINYEKALIQAQRENKNMGYGDRTWSKKSYKNSIKDLQKSKQLH